MGAMHFEQSSDMIWFTITLHFLGYIFLKSPFFPFVFTTLLISAVFIQLIIILLSHLPFFQGFLVHLE